MSSVEWVDSIGAASLDNVKPYPGSRLANWNPNNRPFGARSHTLETGALNVTAFRDDLTVAFDIQHIPNTDMAKMLRLQMHLKRGGAVELVMSDPSIPLFGTCKLAPGADVTFSGPVKDTLEYTVSTVLRGGANTFLSTPDGTDDFLIWFDASRPQYPSLLLHDDEFRIPQWNDVTGNNNHATQAIAYQRPFFELGVQNGLPGVRFMPPDRPDFDYATRMWVTDCLASVTSGEVFIVKKLFADPPISDLYTGNWNFGSAAATYSRYPQLDGVIQESFGNNILRAVPHPGFPLTDTHIYNVASSPTEYTVRINEAVLFTDSVNTPGFRNPSLPYPPLLGVSTENSGFYSSYCHWFEFLFYSPVRTPAQNAAIHSYYKPKWGVVY